MTKKIAVLSAGWHKDIVGSATKSFVDYIEKSDLDAQVDVIEVPGALEIPLAGQRALNNGYDLAVGISFIVDGQIYHREYVAQSVVDAILNVSLKTNKPFLSVCLAPKSFGEHNAHHEKFYVDHFVIKGEEAAEGAVMMLRLPEALQA